MKILIMGGYPLGNRRSGSIIHAQKLAQSLSALAGTEVHFITMGEKTEQLSHGKVNVHVVSMPRVLASLLLRWNPWSVQRKIKGINPDVIHVMGDRFPHSLIAIPLRRRFPLLISIFSFSASESKFTKNPLRLIKTLLISIPSMRYVMPRISHIIVQSHFTGDALKEQSKAKLHLVPEGVDYRDFQKLETNTLPDARSDIFLAVGFRKLKGLDILIRALSIVAKSVPGVRLLLAGSGDEEEVLREMVKELHLDANVKFLGFISNEKEIYPYYKACKIVVVPSRWDVEPFASLHGAASGKPVIASKDSHTSLVIDGETGYLYETEDFADLAGKIIRLLSDNELREKMGRAAGEKAREYAWERIAARTLEVYQKVIADFQQR